MYSDISRAIISYSKRSNFRLWLAGFTSSTPHIASRSLGTRFGCLNALNMAVIAWQDPTMSNISTNLSNIDNPSLHC